MPGNNKDSLTDPQEGAYDPASQTNAGNMAQSLSGQQNLESRVASELDNLADRAESIYIKPDLPGYPRVDRGNLLTQLLRALEDLESHRVRFTSQVFC